MANHLWTITHKAIAEKGGFPLAVSERTQSITTVIGLVAAESGVAIVPESLHYMNVLSVVFRPLADLELVSEVAVAYRGDERSPVANRFLVDVSTGSRGQKQ
jgi:DNA-binding transcriptional LysR family regulator